MAIPTGRLRALLIIVVAGGLTATGCTGSGGPIASDTTDLGTTSTIGELSATTAAPDPSEDSTTIATSAPSTTTTTIATTTTAIATTTIATTTTTEATTTTDEAPIEVVSPGDSGSFTSPSGNIACSMSVEFGASCYIGEKSWTIEQPTGPFCEESDWGNAIDLTASGVTYPCYTDFPWDPTAPALDYGSRMEVGEFSCTSRTSGVTCENGTGGFELARAQVRILVL